MSDSRSIGVFDSGLGGLTVLSALIKKFPKESMIYLGDTARVPYGTKSPETVIQYALNNVRALQSQADLKLLVVACNTATAHALPALQKALDIPVVGVIEPGVLEILRHPEIRSVAVLATAGTVQSKAYEKALRQHGFSGEIYSQACPLFVPLVEEGMVFGEIPELIAKHYLNELLQVPDAVILGCTHYPLLLPVLKKALGASKTLWVDSGAATAQVISMSPRPTSRGLDWIPGQARDDMSGGLNNAVGELAFYVTDAPARFAQLSSLFLGTDVTQSQVKLIDVGVSK